VQVSGNLDTGWFGNFFELEIRDLNGDEPLPPYDATGQVDASSRDAGIAPAFD
jgi:hypothetical protein